MQSGTGFPTPGRFLWQGWWVLVVELGASERAGQVRWGWNKVKPEFVLYPQDGATTEGCKIGRGWKESFRTFNQ